MRQTHDSSIGVRIGRELTGNVRQAVAGGGRVEAAPVGEFSQHVEIDRVRTPRRGGTLARQKGGAWFEASSVRIVSWPGVLTSR